MKITRSVLQSRVDRLNVVLNRPSTAWTRLEKPAKDGHNMRSNEGCFVLSSNSPGDGWTRYSLSQIVGENGGESTVSPTCNAQEMWAYLRGVFDVLDSEYTHRFDDALQPLQNLIQSAKNLLDAKDKTNVSFREALKAAIAKVEGAK
jgi:hypothetical protein